MARPRITGAPARGERRPGWRTAGIAGSRIAAPIVAKRGGGLIVRLKAEWAAAVGNEMAALTWPEALGRDGALRLRVASGSALELQHRAPLVIERINQFFGRNAVSRLVLVQGTVPRSERAPARQMPPPTAAETKALDDRLAGIDDPELRAALAALGQHVLAGRREK